MSTSSMASHIYPTIYKAELNKYGLLNESSHYYRTHTSLHAERLHQASEFLHLPGRWNAQLLAYVIQPAPGANKDYVLRGIAVRIGSFALFLITLPFAIASVIIAMPLRAIDHNWRPAISFFDNSRSKVSRAQLGKETKELVLTKEKPLEVATQNTGFTPTCMSIAGDERDPVERARELAHSINTDPHQADIYFFQETFHEDATAELIEGIKKTYPYIIHNVAPQISGFNSGSMIASKYPIEHVEFHRFNHMLAPESMSPRGIIKAELKAADGTPVLLYGVHTQAILGKERAEARLNQLQDIKKLMEADSIAKPNALQVVMGDFNTSRVTAWGQDNLEPKEQAETPVFNYFNEHFTNVFTKDHHPVTGERTSGAPAYLEADNKRIRHNLPEPRGTWSHGPFANPGWLLSFKMWFDRWWNSFKAPNQVINYVAPSWGTRAWSAKREITSTSFDMFAIPNFANSGDLDGIAEARRDWTPVNAESNPTDHIKLQAKIYRVARAILA